MGAYFFYMEMAVVRFYYEVQKLGVTLELVRRLTVNQVTGIGRRFESFCSHNWTFGIAGAYASLKN